MPSFITQIGAAFSAVVDAVFLLTLPSLLGVYAGRKTMAALRDCRAVLTAPEIKDAGVRSGLVRVEGTVETAVEPVRAPVTGTDCAGYLLSFEQRYATPVVPRWHRDHFSATIPPFSLRTDDQAQVTVDLDTSGDVEDATRPEIMPPGRLSPLHVAEDDRSETIDDPRELPDRFEQFRDAGRDDTPTRIVEHRLDEGEDVTIVARFETGPNGYATTFDDLVLLSDGRSWQVSMYLIKNVGAWALVTAGSVATVGLYVAITFGL